MSKSNVAELKQKEEQRKASREALLSAHIREEEVEVEALGGETVTIKSLTLRQRDEIKQKAMVEGVIDESRYNLLVIVNSLVEPKLTEADIETMMDQDFNVIDEISMHISLLNLPSGAKNLKKELQKIQNSDSQ